MEDRYAFYALWTFLWILVLNLPPGSRSVEASYRLNFLHGLLSSLVAIACLSGYVSYGMTTTCTLSYFFTDFVNIMINDFVFKVPSYHTPTNRRIEYFHHIFCFVLGAMSEFKYDDYCTFEHNPFPKLMFAELSTPFLIIWRKTDSMLFGGLLVVTFFLARIVYHGFVLIPECMKRCHWAVGYGFGLFYDLLNVVFMYTTLHKVYRVLTRKSKSQRSE